MDVHVSLVGRRDLSGEIYRQLRGAILEGRLRGGEALPATRELASRLSVSRTTANVAYERLIAEGYATARPGSGTFVATELGVPGLIHASPRSSVGAAGADVQARASGLRPRSFWDTVLLPTDFWRPTHYDFRAGVPDVAAFPFETWRRLIAHEYRPEGVGRGIYEDPDGHPGLRSAIARHLGTARGVRATAEDVVITNGTQQAVALIARTLLGPGDRVAIEDPGYTPPRRQLASMGTEVIGVPVDDEGLVVDAIPAGTRVVYVTPSHQFPLGMSMSLARRMALLDWAHRADAAIIEDDYDSEFRYSGRPIEPLHLLDPTGRVVYVGSFSKSWLPSIRLGFLISPPSLRHALLAAKYLDDWFSPMATQAAMARLIDDGLFARHVRRMRAAYAERHHRLAELLERDFADELQVVPSTVGLHLTALARTASVERVVAVIGMATAMGFATRPLSTLTGQPAAARAGLVLGYGAIATERMEDGLAILRRAFDAVPA
jgi:GntR family transcriptional regulator/MocR family aminotransferase